MDGLPFELFRDVTDQLPDPLFVKNGAGTYLYGNLAGAKLAGRSINEIAGRTDVELFGADAASISAGDRDVLNAGDVYEDQLLIGEPGSRRCFRVIKSPFRDEGQQIRGIVVQFRELTEALASNEVLRRLAQIDAQSGSHFFEKLVTTICETTGADMALVGELQDENPPVVRTIAPCMDGNLADNCSYPLLGTPCEKVMSHEFCHFHRNVQEGFPKDLMLADLKIEAYVGLPLYASDGRVLGLVALLSRQAFTAPLLVESALRMVGTRAGAELERQQIEQRQQRMLFELSVLNEVGQLCSHLRSRDELFAQITQVIAGRLLPGNCGFLMVDRSRQFLVPHDSFVLTDRNVLKDSIPITAGIIGKTARTGRVHRLGDVRTDPDYLAGDSRTCSELCLPIRIAGEIQGVVNIESPNPNAFSEADERLMTAVVDLAAVAWERIDEAERRAASEQRFRTLFETCSDAILVLDLNGNVVSSNPAAARMHGYTMDEMLALNVRELDDPESAQAVPDRLTRLLAGESMRFEINHLHKDGSRFPVDVVAKAITLDGETMILAFDRDISLQKHAEQALHASENRYRMMLEAIIFGVVVHDGDTIHYANPAAARILGYDTPAALLGRSPFELMPPEVHDLARKSIKRVTTSLQPLPPVELQTYRRDGTVIDVEVHSIICRYNDRRCVQAHFQDITERKRVSEQIRRSEERFSTLFHRCPFSITAGTYPDGRYLEANQAFLDLFEIDRETVLGRTALELNLWETAADRQVMLDSMHREGRLKQGEFWFRTRTGQRRRLLMSVEMITMNGEPALLAMSIDITARRLAEETLRETYTLLQAVTDSATDAIFVKDLEGRYLLVNPAAARFVSQPVEALIGKVDSDIFDDQSVDRIRRNDQRVIAAGVAMTEEETITAAGVTRTYLATKVPYFDSNQQIIGLIGTSRDITERRQMTEALRASEERYRTMLEHLPVGVFVHDGRQMYYVNAAAAQILGYDDTEQLLKIAPLELVAPEYRDLARSRVRDLLNAADQPLPVEAQCLRRNGTRVDVEVRSSRCRHQDRDCVQVLFLDITHRKESEAVLRHMEQRLKVALRGAQTVAFEWDIDHDRMVRYHSSEPTLPETRQTPESMRDVQSRVHPDDRQQFWDNIVSCLRSGSDYFNSFRLVRPDGTIRWLESRGIIERDAQGTPRLLLGVAVDVTDRKLAEAELQASQQMVQAVADASPLTIYLFDLRERRIIYSNYRVVVDLGYSPPDLQNWNWEKLAALVHPDDLPVVIQSLARWNGSVHDEVLESEYRLKHADGSWHWMSGRDTVFRRSRDGIVEQVIGTAQDITDRKNLEQQFLQAQRMQAVGRLAGGVAHDFNNILTIINGYCELLLSQLPEGDASREKVQEIREAGGRGTELTRQLLTFSSHAFVAMQVLDLNSVVAQSERLLRQALGEQIELIFHLSDELLPVRANRSQLDQVLLNLAINARDAMPAGGQLTISTTLTRRAPADPSETSTLPSRDYVNLSVSDTGVGMASEVLTHIFEPFFTTKKAGKGTGLGLSVVHGIVEQCGGEIQIASQLGQGSHFTILLPKSSEPLSADVATDHKPQKVVPGTVLVVEDETMVRSLMVASLQNHGYQVLEACDGEDAMELLEERNLLPSGVPQIDLLLTDIIMPGMSGLWLSFKLRQCRNDLPVLFVSGYAPIDQMSEFTLGQYDAFLLKPFTPEELLDEVDGLVQRCLRNS